MALRLFNTLGGTTQRFVPLRAGEVLFYSCGPTVYDFAHIGNFRSFLAADVLRRWLESPLCQRAEPGATPPSPEPADAPPVFTGGYRVTQVMNITDVGHMVDEAAGGDAPDAQGLDRMEIARRRLASAKKAGTLPPGAGAALNPDDPATVAEFYAQAFLRDGAALGLKVVDDARDHPERMPRPTRHIRGMLEMILRLLDSRHAYIATDGAAYFSTQSFAPYGKLSGNTLDALRSGAGGRVDPSTQNLKKHPADFMLWKPDPTHLMRWDPSAELGRPAPLKEGYPGWHIECSAMAAALLGPVIDLHSGGEDNIFPHHECEIAQSCCAHGTEHFARAWFHPRFLLVDGAKMSKSKGNFYTASDLFSKGFEPGALRLELIKTHYRSNANFTEQGLRDSGRMVERWRTFIERAGAQPQSATAPSFLAPWERGAQDAAALLAHAGPLSPAAFRAAGAFAAAMNDDLNVSGALGAVNAWVGATPAPTPADAALLRAFDGVLGVLARTSTSGATSAAPASEADAHIDDLVRRRTEARRTRNWPEADRLRDELIRLNIVVEDTPAGPKWSRKAAL